MFNAQALALMLAAQSFEIAEVEKIVYAPGEGDPTYRVHLEFHGDSAYSETLGMSIELTELGMIEFGIEIPQD